jgi:hypothetical protein
MTENKVADVAVVDGKVICGWFALCDQPATHAVDHPILGWIPVCTRCVESRHMEDAQLAEWKVA